MSGDVFGNLASIDRAEVLRPETTWFIGDLHLHHSNIIIYTQRPFKDAREMNAEIITRWNSVVKKHDRVFFLGDFSLKPRGSDFDAWRLELEQIVKTLNGRKYMIKGNHDHQTAKWYMDLGFECVSDYPIIILGFVILSHEPVYLEKITPYRNIHGHIHEKTISDEKYINVSAESVNYTPVSLAEIRKRWDDE